MFYNCRGNFTSDLAIFAEKFRLTMFLSIILLLVGLGLILVGANMLTDGSSAVAKRWGVSDLVIGLTVVAFGTSAPELVISLMSAINGSAELAIGNVVGSNIFNVFVIIGITAIVSPIAVDRNLMTKDIPLVMLSALALLAMGNGPLLDGTSPAILTRVDGIILLLFFAVFMRYTFAQAKNIPTDEIDNNPEVKPMKGLKAAAWIILGLAGLIIGGDMFVDNASATAKGLGVSDAIIGLTIVAAGTSLPELATSVTAALKGRTGIALGNVIGSNIFNIFMVLGCSATIHQLPFGSIGNFDLLTMTLACVLFWAFATFYKVRTITRAEGILLTACYIGYIAVLISQL